MASKVLFHNAHASVKRNRLEKVADLFKRAGFGKTFSEGERVAVIASGGRIHDRIVMYDNDLGPQVMARSLAEDLPEKIYALPSPISWKGMEDEEVHGIFYLPQSM